MVIQISIFFSNKKFNAVLFFFFLNGEKGETQKSTMSLLLGDTHHYYVGHHACRVFAAADHFPQQNQGHM